jgi:hypothetical protein
MKTSTKAILLSLLLCPGAGHFVARRPGRGCAFIAIVALALVVVMRQVMQQVHVIADEIQSGAIPLDPLAILDAVHRASFDQAQMGVYVLVACWVVAAIDAYRCARPLDAEPPANPVAH